MLRHMKLKTKVQSLLDAKTATIDEQSFPSKVSISSSSSVSSSEDSMSKAELIGNSQARVVAADSLLDKIVAGPSKPKITIAASKSRDPICKKRKHFTDAYKCITESLSPLTIPSEVSVMSKSTEPSAKKLKVIHRTSSHGEGSPPHLLLLARDEDANHLNPIHCFVRKNIEVFVATERDITAPCPGRKNALVVGQVGLRCVHCYNVKGRDRTKRAVCYPSSISRVYNCVSDMKFDHFAQCKFLPPKEREVFNELRAKRGSNSRGKGGNNTARYYYDSAVSIGMQEAANGMVVLSGTNMSTTPTQPITVPPDQISPVLNLPIVAPTNSALHTLSVNEDRRTLPKSAIPCLASRQGTCFSGTIHHDHRPLATPNDEHFLNPIHCFVRKNVEIFIANSDDVSAPAPGRKKRVTLGQVGVRCVHCKHLSPKYRVKRAICYPPTIASLYHAVSNMKFDHYGACKGLSPTERQHFSNLKAVSNQKPSTGSAPKSSSCTAKYYKESAIRDLGLIDTDAGIRVANNSFVNCKIAPLPAVVISPRKTIALTAEQRTSIEQNHHLQRIAGFIPTMDGMSALVLAACDSHSKQYPSRSVGASFSIGI